MKTALLPLLLLLTLTAFRANEVFFTGKIIYKYDFTDLKGNDINAQVVPFLGADQQYYIDSKNYKSYANNKLQQLYHAETNTYYAVLNDKVEKIDGSTISSKKFKLKHLPETAQIAGFDCKVIQIETDNAITHYYYSPQLRIDKQAFAKHTYGEWNKYLEATNGALSLKIVMRDRKSGIIWTSTATEVIPMELDSTDFILPATIVEEETK